MHRRLSIFVLSCALATPACASDGDTPPVDSLLEDAGDSSIAPDTKVAPDTHVAPDTTIEPDTALATDTGADTEVEEVATDTAPGTSDAPTDSAETETAAAAVCGNGVVESGEACEHASIAGLTTATSRVARTFTDANHCSLRCRPIMFSPFGTDITTLGPAHPTDLTLDRVLYARVPTNNWNPTTYGGYDYRQYYRIVLPVKTRLDVYSMAQTAYEDGKAYMYSTGGTLYTSMELFTFYSADKSTRVGGFTSVRGNSDASPPYAEHNTIELVAGTYYLAVATPYWTASKPSNFTLYTYIEQNPI